MKHLIVAKYQEDTSWVNGIDWDVHVITNGVDRENTGREAGVWFWWIVQNYEKIKPEETYAFVQGDPFPHCVDIHDRLLQSYSKFTPLANVAFECQGDGSPHHPGIPVADSALRWFNMDVEEPIEFYPGAQFAISGEDLLRYPKGFYEAMELNMEEEHAPWCMERLWPCMFS